MGSGGADSFSKVGGCTVETVGGNTSAPVGLLRVEIEEGR